MSKAYVLAVLERAVKSAAQAAILVFVAGQLADGQVNALTVDWSTVGGFALGGFVLSVLTSLATSGFGNDGPSVIGETLAIPTGDDDQTIVRPAPGEH